MVESRAIKKAITICGSQAALAERTGLSQQLISKLLNGSRGPSVETAIAISQATSGTVLISDLRPEIVEAVAAELKRMPAKAAGVEVAA